MSIPKFKGYRRENGRVGIRNHVIILPVDDISNAACEAVANNIKGTLALPHAYGRLQFGEDLELFFRTMIGTGANPNVAACVVIGIEPGWTQRIVDGIAKTGKPVTGFSIERHGDLKTIAAASLAAKEYVQWASEIQRVDCKLNELYISVKCGESDTTTGLGSCPTVGNVIDKTVAMGATASFGETSELTGGEHIVKAKAANAKVAEEFMAVWNDYTAMIMKEKTDDLSESQPTKGNIRGGLTTIEEKAMGNIEKLGKKTKFVGVLKPAEAPSKKGLWFMDTSSAAAEAVTLWAASGAVVHLFPTGQGNIIGNPIEPVIKLSANPLTCSTMSEHIDLDCSAILQGEMSIDQAGDKLLEVILRTCNGRLTAAEALGHREFVMTKLYRSA
jgi:(2R)-sulfolactate sulfo-lyase subunit beta